MRSARVAIVAAAALALTPAAAAGGPAGVNVEFQDFRPTPLDVLPGETVVWSNVSQRRHTVTADDDSFDSGDLFGGNQFSREFDDVGAYPYHCRVHAGMTGEVDVRRVILDVLPFAPVPAGLPVEFTGRTADPATAVTVEEDSGRGFKPVGTAQPSGDGTWSTTIRPQTTGDFRATSGADISEARHMLVTDRHVRVRATRRGVVVTVTPADPYAQVRLELDQRERFGWWPAAVGRLDYVSQAEFNVARPARVRVALVDRDGWTTLAVSPTLRLRRR